MGEANVKIKTSMNEYETLFVGFLFCFCKRSEQRFEWFYLMRLTCFQTLLAGKMLTLERLLESQSFIRSEYLHVNPHQVEDSGGFIQSLLTR